MLFAHDTEVALATAVALVNSVEDGVDQLETMAGLDAFLDQYAMTGERLGTEAELEAVREIRERLRAVWSATDRACSVSVVSGML